MEANSSETSVGSLLQLSDDGGDVEMRSFRAMSDSGDISGLHTTNTVQ